MREQKKQSILTLIINSMAYSANDKSQLINEIQKALSDIIYGSVEVYVQNRKVTQITVRNIKKTSVEVGAGITTGKPEETFPQNIQEIISKTQKSTKSTVKPA